MVWMKFVTQRGHCWCLFLSYFVSQWLYTGDAADRPGHQLCPGGCPHATSSMEWRHRGLDIGSGGQQSRGCLLRSSKALFRRSYSAVRATGVELPRESLVYIYTPEYVTTHLLGEFSENRIRLLEEYSTLYTLATEHPKGQGQECRSRQLIKCYVIII